MFVVYIPNPPSMITDTTKHNKTSKSTYVSKEHGVVICVIIYNSLIIIVIYIYIHLYVCITRLYAYNHISIVYNAPIGSRPTMVSSGCLSGTSSTSAACAVATGGWWSWRSYWRFQWPKMGNPGTKWLLKWENHIIYRYRIDISHTMYIHIYIYICIYDISYIYRYYISFNIYIKWWMFLSFGLPEGIYSNVCEFWKAFRSVSQLLDGSCTWKCVFNGQICLKWP